jgi:hypothetical protein
LVTSTVDGRADDDVEFDSVPEARQQITDAMAAIGAKRVHENVDSNETKAAALLEKRIAGWQDRIDEWAARFAEDPRYALEWAHPIYNNVANVWVAQAVLHDLERGATCEEVAKRLQRDIYQNTSSPSRSTSICSNLMESDVNAARVRMLHVVTGNPMGY